MTIKDVYTLFTDACARVNVEAIILFEGSPVDELPFPVALLDGLPEYRAEHGGVVYQASFMVLDRHPDANHAVSLTTTQQTAHRILFAMRDINPMAFEGTEAFTCAPVLDELGDKGTGWRVSLSLLGKITRNVCDVEPEGGGYGY